MEVGTANAGAGIGRVARVLSTIFRIMGTCGVAGAWLAGAGLDPVIEVTGGGIGELLGLASSFGARGVEGYSLQREKALQLEAAWPG